MVKAATHRGKPAKSNIQMNDLFEEPFVVHRPAAQTLPLVFNSPHSGRTYPESFIAASHLDALSLRASEDCYVDQLFGGVVARGAPLMCARFPRAYLDVNREAFELDPEMFDGPLPAYVNTGSARVAGGLGTIARVVAEDREIYRTPLAFDDVRQRINTLYIPYHRTLDALIASTRKQFGVALLIDCHSMPSADAAEQRGAGAVRPDIVLGDRYGTTCDERITACFEAGLERLGYTVVRNKPYAGGHITQRYGLPASSVHALQIEINRTLYLDEKKLTKTGGFARLANDLVSLVDDLAGTLRRPRPAAGLAAE